MSKTSKPAVPTLTLEQFAAAEDAASVKVKELEAKVAAYAAELEAQEDQQKKQEIAVAMEKVKEALSAAEAELAAAIAAVDQARQKAAADAAPKGMKDKPPVVGNSLVAIGRGMLKRFPHETVVYMTSDGVGFFGRNDAENHARTLKDNGIIKVDVR